VNTEPELHEGRSKTGRAQPYLAIRRRGLLKAHSADNTTRATICFGTMVLRSAVAKQMVHPQTKAGLPSSFADFSHSGFGRYLVEH
jgi:hypothetical protein